MLKIIKFINNIKKEQRLIKDRLDKNTTEFNKEWEKWGTKKTKQEKKLP